MQEVNFGENYTIGSYITFAIKLSTLRWDRHVARTI
jgi:hypothetical protein